MAIDNYSDLKSTVADTLNRTDLTDEIPEFIQLLEAKLRRDVRVRKVQDRLTFTVSSRDTSLPSDFREMISLYHDGDTHYGALDIVRPDQLAKYRFLYGDSDHPRAAAIINRETLRLAPVPDETYTLRMTYNRRLPRLSSSITSNWLLDEHPDIYLYGTLVHSAPFLREDQRVQLWRSLLNEALEELHRDTMRGEFSGNLSRKPLRTLG